MTRDVNFGASIWYYNIYSLADFNEFYLQIFLSKKNCI